MVAFVRKLSGLLILLPLLTSIVSCSSSSNTATESFVMTMSPDTASVAVGMEIPITLTMTGSDQTVTWKLNNVDSGSAVGFGTIRTIPGSTSVIYKAPDVIPPSGSTVTITAARNFPSSSISSTITIVSGPVYTNFSTAGNMITPRYSHTASLLSTGRILVVGGFSNLTTLNSAELCSQTATFTATGNMSVPRAFHTATVLFNGNVLIAGGSSAKTPYGVPLSSAELYHYTTGTFSATGAMTEARQLHAATRLQNGQVLITGGKDASGSNTNKTEIYDPTTAVFKDISSPMSTARSGHTATLLSTGKVLIVGGGGNASGEIFDPTNNTFSPVSGIPGIPDLTGHTATLRNSFDVLITGGTSAAGVTQNAGYLYSDGLFSAAVLMTTPRTGHAAALLANGDVILTGGDNGAGAVLASVDKFSGSAFSTPSFTMKTRRAKHTATALFNGNVMIIGGFNPYSSSVTTKAVGSAEIFK